MTKLLLLASLLLLATPSFAQKVSALPAATQPLAGTELVPCVQPGNSGGTTSKCLATDIATSSPLSGDVATTAGSSVATIQPAAVTLTKQANLAASSVPCNTSTSAATQQACNPLAVANLMSAVISAFAVSTTNITLSGTQVLDTLTLVQGEVVLVAGQTTSANDGIYIVQSGAWTRAINFPSGYVISQNCSLSVHILNGSLGQGRTYSLTTTTGAITIGTTAQTWKDSTIAAGTSSTFGLVKLGGTGASVAPGYSTIINGSGQDCMNWGGSGTNAGAQNAGNVAGDTGPCVVADPNGHPFFDAAGDPPVVTGTGCSLQANSTDNRGAIVATGVDACTLTFGDAFTNAPFCTVSGVGATVLPRVHALASVSAATFDTAAAGTFTYVCL